MGGVHSTIAAARSPRERWSWRSQPGLKTPTAPIAASRRFVVEIADLTQSQREERC